MFLSDFFFVSVCEYVLLVFCAFQFSSFVSIMVEFLFVGSFLKRKCFFQFLFVIFFLYLYFSFGRVEKRNYFYRSRLPENGSIQQHQKHTGNSIFLLLVESCFLFILVCCFLLVLLHSIEKCKFSNLINPPSLQYQVDLQLNEFEFPNK